MVLQAVTDTQLPAKPESAAKCVRPALAGADAQERDLVQKAQQLDPSALSSLYKTYYPRVYGYAYLQLGDVQTAEDVASDVMLKLLESIKGYRLRGVPFSAWVFRIARNRIIDYQRRRQRRREVDLDEGAASASEDVAAAAERGLERSRIQAALLRLKEEQRQVIILKFIHGFDNASAAGILGRSEGAVKSLQHRALVSLRRILADGEPSSGRQSCRQEE